MGVEFHRIGLAISSGSSHNGFGKIVSSSPVTGDFPPAGSYAGTVYGIEYPIELGGASFASPIDFSDVPSQTCDVDELNDGFGGTYLDATSITNVNYKTAGTLFYTGSTVHATQTPAEVPEGSGEYYDSEFTFEYLEHDGGGYWQEGSPVWQYYADDTYIVDYNAIALFPQYWLEVPSGSTNYFETGKYNQYRWNGTGGYDTLTNQGSFYSSGTLVTQETEIINVPSGGDTYPTGRYYRYNWNGTGGYVGAGYVGSYYSSGTYIFDDGTDAWYWDGTGGYYSEPL